MMIGLRPPFSGGCQEFLDGLREPDRLVQRQKRVAISYLDQSALREGLGQPTSMLEGHHLVLGCPNDQGRAVELRQAERDVG